MKPFNAPLRFSLVLLIGFGVGLAASAYLSASPPTPVFVRPAFQAPVAVMPAQPPQAQRMVADIPSSAPPEAPAVARVPLPAAPEPASGVKLPIDTQSGAALPMEQTVAQLINERRRGHGLPALTWASELMTAARRHSRDMAHHQLTQHTGSDGSNGGQRIHTAGYQWEQWDETIAWGALDPDEVVEWFFNSATHRTVLLSNEVTDIGVGFVSDTNSQWRRYWTVNVASKASRSAPAAAYVSSAAPAPADATTIRIADQDTANSAGQWVQSGCPTASVRQYDLIPMEWVDQSHVDYLHADLNLGLRGFVAASGDAGLIEIAGPTDADAPQLANLFAGSTQRHFSATYQTHDWNWSCGADGCRSDRLTQPEVTLLGIVTAAGEVIHAPTRAAEIYGGGYIAVVLYADQKRITLAYTRDGTVANGYAVHLEPVCVDANLLAAYRRANGAGRDQLPALRANQVLGEAAGAEIIVAVRDRGTFLDPRSRKDWWSTAQTALLPYEAPK